MNGEAFHEHWEHFNKLCANYPQHQICEQLLIQYFHEGLLPIDINMVDAASEGGLWLIRLQLKLESYLISWCKTLNNLELGNLSLGRSMSLVWIHLYKPSCLRSLLC